jgi:predicted small secreted protein
VIMKIALLLLVAMAALAASGCNTVRGVGEDLTAVGGTLSRAGGG